MTALRSRTSPDDTTRKADFNLLHVTAAALAAVTAAVLGSTLGAPGTLIGAAVVSLITTVGTAVYKASLERGRERVRALAHRAGPLTPSREDPRDERSDIAAGNAPFGDEQLTDRIEHGPQRGDRSPWFATLRWGAVVVGALGAFLLAMMVITGFEWASGQTVGGNGKGTTIGQVVDDQPGPRSPTAPPAPNGPTTPTPPSPGAPASETPTESPQAPDTSTTTPDGDAGVEPSPPPTSDGPVPGEVIPTPPLIPPGLPGGGG